MVINPVVIHFVKVPFSLMREEYKMKSRDVCVYAAIRMFADFGDGSNCFPSRSKIAKLACCSEGTVDTSIKRLKEKGHLYWVRGCEGRSNRYSFPTLDQSAVVSASTHYNHSPRSTTDYQEPYNKNQYLSNNQLKRIEVSGYGDDEII
jgi:hypothetical protein